MTRLILVRHGQSVVNVTFLASDNWEDNPLTDLGRSQAADLAARLQAGGPHGVRAGEVVHVYTSGMQRARETGQLLAAELGTSSSQVDGLEEIRVGICEGESGQVAYERAIRDFRTWFVDGDLDHGYVGGENGRETVVRVATALRELVSRHPGQTVVVVSHGCSIAFTVATLCPQVPLTALHDRLLANCGHVELEVALGDGPDDDDWACVHWQGEDPAGLEPAA